HTTLFRSSRIITSSPTLLPPPTLLQNQIYIRPQLHPRTKSKSAPNCKPTLNLNPSINSTKPPKLPSFNQTTLIPIQILRINLGPALLVPGHLQNFDFLQIVIRRLISMQHQVIFLAKGVSAVVTQTCPVFIARDNQRPAALVHIHTILIQIGPANIFGATYNDLVITVLTTATLIPRSKQIIKIAFAEDKWCFNSGGTSVGIIFQNGALAFGQRVPFLRLC